MFLLLICADTCWHADWVSDNGKKRLLRLNLIYLVVNELLSIMVYKSISAYFTVDHSHKTSKYVLQILLPGLFSIYQKKLIPLREKCPNTEFFLVRVFRYGEIWSISPYSVRMPGKYGPEKTPYLDTFHAVSTKVSYRQNAGIEEVSVCKCNKTLPIPSEVELNKVFLQLYFRFYPLWSTGSVLTLRNIN